MKTKTEHISIRTERVGTFTPDIQRAFIGLGMHIDWLVGQSGESCSHVEYQGSDSWIPEHKLKNKVMFKTFPWDHRFKQTLDLHSGAHGGVAVMIRDEQLTPAYMRLLWEEYSSSYRHSPPMPLYSVRPHPKVDFQLIIFPLGDSGCDILRLPGVDEAKIDERLAARIGLGESVSPDDEDNELLVEIPLTANREARHFESPLLIAIGGLIRNAKI